MNHPYYVSEYLGRGRYSLLAICTTRAQADAVAQRIHRDQPMLCLRVSSTAP
jgi:hypothetical protein